jgi:hypothetical protein
MKKLWNEIPIFLREMTKPRLKKSIKKILINIFEQEDTYLDISTIVSKMKIITRENNRLHINFLSANLLPLLHVITYFSFLFF